MGADSDAERRARTAEAGRTASPGGRTAATVREIYVGQTISMGHGADGAPRVTPPRDTASQPSIASVSSLMPRSKGSAGC